MDIVDVLLWLYVAAYTAYWLTVFIGGFLRDADDAPGHLAPLSLGIVIPCYNEAPHIDIVSMALAMANQLRATVVIVDDGSTDGSDERLALLCDGTARVLRHEQNRGKACALNTGIAALDTDLILTLDADTMLTESDIRMAMPLFDKPHTGAVALSIDGDGTNYMAKAQTTEYRYVLDFERNALSRFGIVFTVPGSASIWRRRALEQIGNFSTRTCAEDTDATISLSLSGWHVVACARSRAVTVCPSSIGGVVRQRSRWVWGTIQSAAFAAAGSWRSPRRSGTASAFVAITALNVCAFLLVPIIIVNTVIAGINRSEIVAGLFLFATTFIRIVTVRRLQSSDKNVFALLADLILMQGVNMTGFWHGLCAGRFVRMSW